MMKKKHYKSGITIE